MFYKKFIYVIKNQNLISQIFIYSFYLYFTLKKISLIPKVYPDKKRHQ